MSELWPPVRGHDCLSPRCPARADRVPALRLLDCAPGGLAIGRDCSKVALMSLLRQVPNPRKAFVASWLFAGWLVIITALLSGSVPIGTVAGLYLGFGAGVELTLFIGGWRAARNTRVHGNRVIEEIEPAALAPPEEPAALAPPQEQAQLFDVLRGLDVGKREAAAIAKQVPTGLTLEERVREGLKVYAERRDREERDKPALRSFHQ